MDMKYQFIKISQKIAEGVGHPFCFFGAFTFILLWAVCGPLFGFSDTWQLVVNTTTTIITFLMVFLIQSTQNRDSEAIHLKLDELIRATKDAHLALLDIEEVDDEAFQAFRKLYASIGEEARARLERGEEDIYRPQIELMSIITHKKNAEKDAKADKKPASRAKKKN